MNNQGQNAQPIHGAGAAAAANNQMVNQLWRKTKDSVTAKFMCNRIIIAQATYRWSDAATAGNFKLALRG
jgi:hypothetical protein